MVAKRIELRLRHQGQILRTLVLGPDESRIERAGVVLSARRQSLDGGAVVRTTISNRSDDTVQLDSLRFDIDTGFSAMSRRDSSSMGISRGAHRVQWPLVVVQIQMMAAPSAHA
jgi:hypothetical protein